MTATFGTDSHLDVNRLWRLTIVCLFIGISYEVCMVPTVIGYFNRIYLGNAWTDPFLPDEFYYVSSFLVTLNSIINPCIYFLKVYYDRKIPTTTNNNTTPKVQRGDSTKLLHNGGQMDEGDGRNHGDTRTTLVEGGGSWGRQSSRGSMKKSKSNDFLLKSEGSSAASMS